MPPPSRPHAVRRGRQAPRPKLCQRCGNGGHRAYEALTCPVVSTWLADRTVHPADRHVLSTFDTETVSICAMMYIRTWFGDECVYDLLGSWPFGTNFTKRARSCITLMPTSASSLDGDPLVGRNLVEDLVRDPHVRSCVRTLLANGRGPHFPAGGTVEPASWRGYPFSAYDSGRQKKKAPASQGARLRWKLPHVNLFSLTFEKQRREALKRPASASAARAALVGESAAGRKRRREDEERKKARERDRAEVEQRTCVVCTADAAVVAIVPCGHVCLCQDCEGAMRKHNQRVCPMCRTSIRETLRVFT